MTNTAYVQRTQDRVIAIEVNNALTEITAEELDQNKYEVFYVA